MNMYAGYFAQWGGIDPMVLEVGSKGKCSKKAKKVIKKAEEIKDKIEKATDLIKAANGDKKAQEKLIKDTADNLADKALGLLPGAKVAAPIIKHTAGKVVKGLQRGLLSAADKRINGFAKREANRRNIFGQIPNNGKKVRVAKGDGEKNSLYVKKVDGDLYVEQFIPNNDDEDEVGHDKEWCECE